MKGMLMGKADRIMGARFEHNNFEALKFQKTGKEIAQSLDGLIKGHRDFIEVTKTKMTEICKRRDITVEEVLGAQDEEAIEAYSTRMMRSVGGENAASAVLRKLQEEINQLRSWSGAIGMSLADIEAMLRIQKNIEPGRIFDLSHSELVAFGF